MSFMPPQLDECEYWEIETDCGMSIVPASVQDAARQRAIGRGVAQELFADYVEGTITSAERKQGWIWRLSAPGYLDCTDWCAADSPTDAVLNMIETYGDGFDIEDLEAVAQWFPSFDYFWSGYLTALAFTGTLGDDKGTSIRNMPGDIRESFDMFEKELRCDDVEGYGESLADCLLFFCDAEILIGEEGPRFEEAGSDFHYTRNGHGCGFWDGDWPTNGDRLTELCKPYGNCEVELSGGDAEGGNKYQLIRG